MRPSIDGTVLAPLQYAQRRRLVSATCGALRKELAGLPLEPPLYLGGEVTLDFGAKRPLIITWDENAGWEDHFSLQIRNDSAFRSGALEQLAASHVEPWSHLVGTLLAGWRVLGSNGTPHVVELTFGGGRVFIGDGWENAFGDGDDILVALDLGSFNGIVMAESDEMA